MEWSEDLIIVCLYQDIFVDFANIFLKKSFFVWLMSSVRCRILCHVEQKSFLDPDLLFTTQKQTTQVILDAGDKRRAF